MSKTHQQGDEISSATPERHSPETPEKRQRPTKRGMIWVAIAVGLLLGTALFFAMISLPDLAHLINVATATRSRR